MVRDTKTPDEPIEITGGIASPGEMCAQRRPLVRGQTAIANPDGAGDIIARVHADFERLFGSE